MTVAPPAPQATCPFLTEEPPTSPPAAADSVVVSSVTTPSVDLATVGATPSFAIGTGIQIAGSAASQPSVFIQLGACVAPTAPGLTFNIVEDNTDAVAVGDLVDTVGTKSAPGYLFRGHVTVAGGVYPEGITSTFVAQLALDVAANTAQLSLAFIAPPAAPQGTVAQSGEAADIPSD